MMYRLHSPGKHPIPAPPPIPVIAVIAVNSRQSLNRLSLSSFLFLLISTFFSCTSIVQEALDASLLSYHIRLNVNNSLPSTMASEMDQHDPIAQSISETKAEYRRLGKTGLKVSVPIFGAMSFGTLISLYVELWDTRTTADAG